MTIKPSIGVRPNRRKYCSRASFVPISSTPPVVAKMHRQYLKRARCFGRKFNRTYQKLNVDVAIETRIAIKYGLEYSWTRWGLKISITFPNRFHELFNCKEAVQKVEYAQWEHQCEARTVDRSYVLKLSLIDFFLLSVHVEIMICAHFETQSYPTLQGECICDRSKCRTNRNYLLNKLLKHIRNQTTKRSHMMNKCVNKS